MGNGPSPSRPPKRWSGMASNRPGGLASTGSRPDTSPRGSEYIDTQQKEIKRKDS